MLWAPFSDRIRPHNGFFLALSRRQNPRDTILATPLAMRAAMEDELIAWLTPQTHTNPAVRRGIGDDAAVLQASSGHDIVVTTDMLMDQVDFVWGEHAPALIGRKSLAVNLSDLAAMGARPLAAFVSLAIPRSFSLRDVQDMFRGILDLAGAHNVQIAGGDTNTYQGGLVISVTAIGEAPCGRAWGRSGAKPADRILVSGPLGGSILEHQFTFTPRVAEALAWRETTDIHAAIDISDGFSLDLARLLKASRCGAIVNEPSIPIRDAARQLSARGSGKSALAHALGDGEDFELILIAEPKQAEVLRAFAAGRGQFLVDVGEVTAGTELLLRSATGELSLLPVTGYLHELAP